MLARASGLRRWGALALVIAAACSPSEDELAPGMMACETATMVQGEGVDYTLVGYDVDDFCPASFEAVESHIQWVAGAWGVFDPHVDYHLVEGRDSPCWLCSEGAGACGADGALSTTRLPDHHELAHAVHGANCSSLVEEGWATLFAGPFEDAETTGSLRGAIETVAREGRLPGGDYPLAARFVAYLLEVHDIETVRELCAISFTDAAELDAALLEVTGSSLDDVQLALDESPPVSLGQLRQDQACEGLDAALSPAALTMGFRCSDDGVVGRVGGPVWTQRLVELPEPGAYTFTFDASEDVELLLELRNCARDGLASRYYAIELSHPTPGAPAALLLTDLPAGTYVLRVMINDTSSLGLDLRVGVDVESWL